MISDNLQGGKSSPIELGDGDLTLAAFDEIIPKIHITKALMETSMFLARSQRTRVGVSRAIPKVRKSFLSVN
jgi:hypothetical protein